MNLVEAKDRYERDPQFRAVVDMLVAHGMSLEMSLGELREAAIFAELRIQCMRPVTEMFPCRAVEIDNFMRSQVKGKSNG